MVIRWSVAVLCLLGSLVPQQRIPLARGWQGAPALAQGQRPPDRTYRPITVPAAFEHTFGADFEGAVWYRRTLDLRGVAGLAVGIECRAAATEATVYLDGVPVGHHLGSWTPFRTDLTPHLVGTSPLLEILVHERTGHDTQGFLPVIQPHAGGLWQDVFLTIDDGPVLDRIGLLTFGRLEDGVLQVEVPVRGATADCRVRVTLTDGATVCARATFPVPRDGPVTATIPAGTVRPWAPGDPHLYGCTIELFGPDGTVHDRVRRSVGFRDVDRRGTTLLWNGRPLQVRGMLHWGVAPPHHLPPDDEDHWRRQFEAFKAMGCNMVKACLWLPPPSFFRAADEVGLLVWQEYPTWHPRMDDTTKSQLLTEFAEFHRRDRSHPSVAFRSLTCETGHGADLAVIEALYHQAHRMVPDSLVVDDSSWITWHRIHDFYDDHPYGNNRWWPGKLASMTEHIATRTAMPLLLGECITSDTWFDRQAWHEEHGDRQRWWQPLCLTDQAAFEQRLVAAFGPETLASLHPISRDYALRNRKYQVERCRLSSPDTGYVLSVHRDFTKARMGFFDDLDRPKWSPGEWAWHRDTMLCLDTADDRRAFVGTAPVRVRLSHYGRGAFDGTVHLSCPELGIEGPAVRLQLQPGTVSEPVAWNVPVTAGQGPRRYRIEARATGSHPATNHWDLWWLPPVTEPPTGEIREVRALDPDTLSFLEAGGRVLLRAGNRKGSLRTTSLWYLRGAPFAPPHPVHDLVPAELLLELQTFDLEGPDLMPWDQLWGQVDPILAYWETHDLDEVRSHLFAFETRVGAGRLLATTLDHETAAGQWVLQRFRTHLVFGEQPRRALARDTVAALGELLTAQTIDLPRWRLRTDPDDIGRDEKWQELASAAGDPWRDIKAGAHWEGQGMEHYTGIAWYRIVVDVPAQWQGQPVRAVFDGVDDSYHLFVNGQLIGSFGDPATGETVWLQRTWADISGAVRCGEKNVITLRVVDHGGAGGLWKPAFLTTGPAGEGSRLLH